MYAEDIKSFLESRNLSITRFARLVGVKYNPVRFYGTGENGYLDERTRRKIEAGLIVLRENESLKAPVWNKRYNFDTSYPRYIQKKREHEDLVKVFESEFNKRLVELGLGEIDV